jgi:8-oxo-dGTP diphosphatase
MDFTQMDYEEIIAYFRKKLPSFPDGRIDYHGSPENFVFNIRIRYDEKILLLKRSDKIGAYKGKWDSIWWFIDEEKPADQKISEEIHEELWITPDEIQSIHKGRIHVMMDKEMGRARINYPVLVTLQHEPKIQLDRENSEYQWITPDEIIKFDTVPELEKSYQYATV